MKHVGKLLSFVAALFLALTAVCGALAESTPSGTITVLSFTEYPRAVQAAIDAFAGQTDVTIKLENIPSLNTMTPLPLAGQLESDFDVIKTDDGQRLRLQRAGLILWSRVLHGRRKEPVCPAMVKAGTFRGQP